MSDVAVVLSVYKKDSLQTLVLALESLFHQTKNVDVFVQQDGYINKEVEKYLDTLLLEKSIIYLGKRSENRGIALSYNELFREVLKREYSYIARMDADDISVPQRIEWQYMFMEKHKKVDVVGGSIEEFGDDFEYKKIVKYPLTHREIFKFFAKRTPLANVTTFFRISYFKKAGLYPISSPTNEDTLFWLAGFSNQCIFANLEVVLVKVRVSKDFFERRGGFQKAWSDLKDRWQVIQILRYNLSAYFYALALFVVNISPASIKKFLYQKLR